MNEKLSQIGTDTTCPIAFIEKDGKVLIGLRHYKEASLWTCPRGRCDPGETLEQTLRREIEEETGITDIEILSYIEEIPGSKEGDAVHIFHCKTTQEFENREPHKFSEWRWVQTSEVPDNFINKQALTLLEKTLKV